MALIVEDGTGLSTAESYISVADADTYIAAYKGANTTWDGATEADKEIAARQATQYLDGRFYWKGQVSSSTQVLDFPRDLIYDEIGTEIEGVPTGLEQACATAMLLIVTGETLTVNVSRDDQVKRKKVDVLETEWEVGASQQPTYPEIGRLLSGLFFPSGRSVRS